MSDFTGADLTDQSGKCFVVTGANAGIGFAIARALANKPPFILADEPTAPLDTLRSMIVIRLLMKLAQEYQTAIIVVTHDDTIIPHFKRIYRLRDGIAYEEQGQGLPFPE